MFVIYLLISSIVLIIGIIIGTQNGSQFVDVYLLGWHFSHVPLNLVMLESFVFGILVITAVVVFHEIKLRYRMYNLQREIKSLEDEIRKLRQIPIENMEIAEKESEESEISEEVKEDEDKETRERV